MGLFKQIERNINARKYDKTIEESSGLKKIYLMVRNQGVEFSLGLSKGSGDSNLSFEMMGVISMQMLFADIFYTTLNDSFVRVGGSPDEMFDDLATELYKDYNKRRIIASRLFGIAFAIFTHKAADASSFTINKKEISKLIESSEVKEELKSELNNSFLYMMDFYDDPIARSGAEGAMVSHDLGILAYSLVDMRLEKNHFADPLYTMAMATAESLAYKEASINDFNVDALKKAKLLK